MTMHHDIDKLFQEGLKDYSPKPAGFVWDNIEQKMRTKRVAQRKNFIYSMAAAVALLLSFGAGYLFHFFSPVNEKQLAVEQPTPATNTADNAANPFALADTTAETYAEVNQSENDEAPLKQEIVQPTALQQPHVMAQATAKEESLPVEGLSATDSLSNKPARVKAVQASGSLAAPSFANTAQYQQMPVFADDQEKPATAEDQNEPELQPMHYRMNESFAANPDPVVSQTFRYKQLPDYAVLMASPDEEKENVWAMGLNATPLVSYRNVNTAANESVSTNTDGNSERPLIAYAAGVDVNYAVAKRWKIHSGFYMSEVGQVSNDVMLNASDFYSAHLSDDMAYNVSTSVGNVAINKVGSELEAQLVELNNLPNFAPAGTDIKDAGLSSDLVQSRSYLEIPLMVSYILSDKKLGVEISGGLSTNILYDEKAYLISGSDKYDVDAEVEGLNNISYNGMLGLGFNYKIVSNLKLNLQPTFRYALNPVSSSSSVYPYSFGVFTGLQYQF